MTRSDRIIKWTAYGVALAVIAIVNYYLLGLLPIALPLMLPMAAVAAGTLENPKFGAGFGMMAGLLLSILGHRGLLCIPILSAAGCLCAILARHVRQDLVGHFIYSSVLALLWECAQVLWLWTGKTAPLPQLLQVALPELLWTIIFTIPVYGVFRFCCVRYGRIYHE